MMKAKFSKNILSLCWLFILGIYVTAFADYHYANHGGSNEYPYTSWETAAWLIQNAVDAASPGDTVYVGEGTWNQQTQIWTNSLALIGMGIDSTILENYETTQIKVYSDTVLIEGFSFISDFLIHPSSAISCLNLGYVIVKNNYFYGNAAGVSGNMGGLITNNFFEYNWDALRTVAVRKELIFKNNNILHNHVLPAVFIEDWVADTSKFYIRNNLFYEHILGNTFYADNFFPTDTVYIHNNIIARKLDIAGIGHFCFGWSSNWQLFYNNSIDGTSEGDNVPHLILTGIESRDSGEGRTIDNNIVINCELGLWRWNESDTTPVQVRYSDFFNVETYFDGSFDLGVGNIFTDPMFVDTLDFHLQAYSPAIDAGDPEVYDPDSSRSDIGAYGGPHGEYYEYQDLPPMSPDSLTAEVSAGLDTIYLSWLYNTEADFNGYQIHRDTITGFEPSIFNMIAEPETSLYIDTDFDLQHSYYYLVAAVDNQDNVSEYSDQVGVVFTGFDDYVDPNLPRSVVLHQNYPNPFNQNTIIKYYLPNIGYQPAEVQLYIYDVLGRLVKRLVDERRYPGEHVAVWDGTGESGNELPSGVYFYRLIVSKAEFSKPRKLMLLR